MNSKIYIQTHSDKIKFYHNEKDEKNGKNININNLSNNYIIYNVNDNHDDYINIDKYNLFFCEYCSMYTVWKNKIQSDIVSFCHYRRVIPEEFIYKNLIFLNNDGILFYYLHYIKAQRLIDFYRFNIDENISKFNLAKKHMYFMIHLHPLNLPDFFVNDTLEYIDNVYKQYFKSYIINFDINKYYNENKFILYPNRSIFSCNWNTFNKLMNYLDNYFKFIFNKYNIDINNKKQVKEWYLNNIIKHLQENTDYRRRQYTDLYKYNYIFSKAHAYGYDMGCYSWRQFSYIVEILIGMFILFNNNKHIALGNVNLQKI